MPNILGMLALEEIGTQVAAVRKNLRLRQADLASRAGISRATVDALENGRASDIGFSKLARILRVLGLEMRIGPAAAHRPTMDDLLKERAVDV
jgi:transcriptional regulator with XRE-family HTH domain